MAAVTTESHSIETVSAPSTADPEAPAVRERETVVVERERRRGRGGLLGFLARWLWRLLAVLLILGLLGGLLFLGVTLVLRSDVPRGIAEDVATGLLKHDVSLGGLDVGWGGHVELTDLALRLPSEAGEGRGPLVAEVPRATAELGPLPMLAVKFLTGGNLLPESVTAESPRVYMTQDDDGEWTLPRSAELLASAGGKSDPNAPTGPITLPPLPALTVSDGTIVVRNNEGVERVADGLRVDADSPSPLIYQADLELPGFLDVSAELIPTNGRNQTVRLSATGLNDLAEPYLPGLPPLDVTATWDGSFTGDGGVAGRVRFDESSTLQGIGLGGAVAVSAGGAGGVVEVAPDGLTLSNLPGGLGEAVVRAGTITAGGPALGVDDLLVEVAGGSVLVSTLTLDPDALAGTLVVGFTGVAPPGLDDSSLSGTAEGSLWLSDYGEVRARLGVEAGGVVAGNRVETFSAAAEVEGEGYRNFETLDARFSVPEEVLIAGGAGQTTPLPPVEGLVRVRLEDDNPYVELATIEALGAPGELRASGRYYLPQPENDLPAYYGVWAEARGWPVALPRMDGPLPLDVGAVAAGAIGEGQGTGVVTISDVYGSYGDIQLAGSGGYILAVPPGDARDPDGDGQVDDPLYLTVFLARSDLAAELTPRVLPEPPNPADAPPGFQVDDEADVDVPDETVVVRDLPDAAYPPSVDGGASEEAAMPPIRGDVRSTLVVVGNPSEQRFRADGELVTENFGIGPYMLGDVRAGLDARLADDVLTANVTDADVLGARLGLLADVPLDDKEPGRVTLDLAGLELARVCEAIGLEVGGEPVTGTVDVDRLTLRLRGLDLSKIRADGPIVVRDLATFAGPVADRVTLRPRLARNRLSVAVRMEQDLDLPAPPPGLVGAGPAGVTADANRLELTAEADLGELDQIVVRNLSADGYPLALDPEFLGGEVTGAAELTAASEQLVIGLTPPDAAADPNGFALPVTIDGELAAGLRVLTGPTPFDLKTLAAVDVAIAAEGAVVRIEELEGRLPDVGRFSGDGTLALADLPGRSNLVVTSTLELGALADRLDLPRGGAGELDVTIAVTPAPGDRPKGEVLADVAFEGRGANWRGLELDRGQVIAYLSRPDRPNGTKPAGAYDFTLVTTDRIRVFAAGGLLDGYFKFRDRGEGNGGRFVTARVEVDDAQLSQVGPILLEKDNVEGNIDLVARLFGPVDVDGGVAEFNGSGRLEITDARLGNFDLIRVILQSAGVLPFRTRDYLRTRFRLEQGDLYASGAEVLADGIEIRGNFEVRDLLGTEDRQPIDGQVIVLAKPLAAFKLPFFAEATEILDAIQANATALNLAGTLDKPVAYPAALGEVGDLLGGLLGRGQRPEAAE